MHTGFPVLFKQEGLAELSVLILRTLVSYQSIIVQQSWQHEIHSYLLKPGDGLP